MAKETVERAMQKTQQNKKYEVRIHVKELISSLHCECTLLITLLGDQHFLALEQMSNALSDRGVLNGIAISGSKKILVCVDALSSARECAEHCGVTMDVKRESSPMPYFGCLYFIR